MSALVQRADLGSALHVRAPAWAYGCSTRGEASIPLRLISAETFKTGVLNLVYAPAEALGDAAYDDANVNLAQPAR